MISCYGLPIAIEDIEIQPGNLKDSNGLVADVLHNLVPGGEHRSPSLGPAPGPIFSTALRPMHLNCLDSVWSLPVGLVACRFVEEGRLPG